MSKFVPIEGRDLTGKRIKLRDGVLKPQFAHERPIATGGFGCNPNAIGRAVFVTFDGGGNARLNRDQVDLVEVDE